MLRFGGWLIYMPDEHLVPLQVQDSNTPLSNYCKQALVISDSQKVSAADVTRRKPRHFQAFSFRIRTRRNVL